MGSAVFGTAIVVQVINQSPLYGHLLPIKGKQFREFFASDWPIKAKPPVYKVLSEHILDYMLNRE